MDMTDLYQEKILAFARATRASTLLPSPMATAEIKNPACGDLVRVDLNFNDNGIITAIGAHSEGCALCEAGTGLLLSLAEGRHSDDILPMALQLRTWLAHEHENLLTADQDAFTPAREFTARHQCITLSFEAAAKAISNT